MQVPFVVLQVVPWKQNRWPHTSPGAVHMNVYVCLCVCACVCVCARVCATCAQCTEVEMIQ